MVQGRDVRRAEKDCQSGWCRGDTCNGNFPSYEREERKKRDRGRKVGEEKEAEENVQRSEERGEDKEAMQNVMHGGDVSHKDVCAGILGSTSSPSFLPKQ